MTSLRISSGKSVACHPACEKSQSAQRRADPWVAPVLPLGKSSGIVGMLDEARALFGQLRMAVIRVPNVHFPCVFIHVSFPCRARHAVCSLFWMFSRTYSELAKYGNLLEMHVCDNVGDHLIGNVYARYDWEEEAQRAVDGLNDRWYAGESKCSLEHLVRGFGRVALRRAHLPCAALRYHQAGPFSLNFHQ